MTATDNFRVTFGWSAYQDFPTAPAAAAFVDDLIDQPTGDPLCRTVRVLDLGSGTMPFPTLVDIDRPLVARAS